MKSGAVIVLIGVALVLGGCSVVEEAPEAPAGAMEGFARKHALDEAGDKAERVEAARAREVARAADARQKVQAAEGMARFDRAEKALDAGEAITGE